jgi:flagellar protein FlaF
MYKFSYAEIIEADCSQQRSRERTAFDEAITMMTSAEEVGIGSAEATEAVRAIQRLWGFLIGDLANANNELDKMLRADLISIGLWSIAEADRILTAKSTSFAALIEVNSRIRDGLQ